MSAQQLITMDCVAVVVLSAAVYFTRATPRRALAALVGGVVGTLCGMTGDIAGHYLGWWYYVGATSSHAPLLVFVAVSLNSGGVALVGWRVKRRFGWRGLAVFIGAMAVFSTTADAIAAVLVGLQIFTPGLLPVVGDVIVWGIVNAVGQGVMSVFAGPAANDRLARTRAYAHS